MIDSHPVDPAPRTIPRRLLAAALLTSLAGLTGPAMAAGVADSTLADLTLQTGNFRVMAANDLGMHCADQDYKIFSILPPFNVIHAQALRIGTSTTKPRLLNDNQLDLYYSAVSNPRDPVGQGSLNSTSRNAAGAFKSNFWNQTDGGTLAVKTYAPLYPNQQATGTCPPGSLICASALELFDPLPADTGLPVPDPLVLPNLSVAQQQMPSDASGLLKAQPFLRFDRDLPFFANFPFGTTVMGVNWWSADGIPILPTDDTGRSNAYPLMKVSALRKGADPRTSTPLASVDVVLPVASEADCQNCHASPDDYGSGRASTFAETHNYANGRAWQVMTKASAPGPQKLQNASKINILRLHDAKHGKDYTTAAGQASPCRGGWEASCLDKRRAIQCSQCHYTPALDLAQVGPIDEPEQGDNGRQQTRHISMSRAMHGHHGQFTALFPEMPAPGTAARTPAKVQEVLDETCYQCHPGKNTKCLRGAMASAGVVCQDCHGNMKQVGNDFSGGLPNGKGLNLAKRVPWANEPQCQSCHIGDAVSVLNRNRTDFIVAPDGIRLLQAYTKSSAAKAAVKIIAAPKSRFAENESLYRLSKGHGGVMCEGCHGSTHAIWPVQPGGDNPNQAFLANDNLAAIRLQGHSGTLVECKTCHAPGSLPVSLGGPHGMHPVDDAKWIDGHEHLAEGNPGACKTCHGLAGEGTVLSKASAARTLRVEGRTVSIAKGTKIGCGECHSNPMTGGGGGGD